MMPDRDTQTTYYTHTNLHFWVDLGKDYDTIKFTECSGLSMETEIATIVEGGQNSYDRKHPGKTTFSNIVLKHGIDLRGSLFQWYWDCITTGFTRRNITIHLHSPDPKSGPVVSWHLLQAFPVRWEGPFLSADAGSIAIESLELAFEAIAEQTSSEAKPITADNQQRAGSQSASAGGGTHQSSAGAGGSRRNEPGKAEQSWGATRQQTVAKHQKGK